jgi:hypothetical protein
LLRATKGNLILPRRALNSAVECHLHTVEVTGSNPVAPTTPSIFPPLRVLSEAEV